VDDFMAMPPEGAGIIGGGRRDVKWWVAAGALAAAVALRVAAAARPEVVERLYAQGAYPVIAAALAAAARRAPLSVAEAAVAVMGAAGLFLVARGAARAVRGRTFAGVIAVAPRAIALAAAIYLAFLLLWGLNYHRQPLAASVGLPVAAAGRDELAAACAELIALADTRRAEVGEDASGVARLSGGPAAALDRAGLGFDAADGRWAVLRGPRAVVKPALLSPVLARLGISGIFVPFTGEAHVNLTLPEWTLPFTAAHEVAHQRGFAREDEANYLAYATCSRHPDPEARYAAALMASAYALAALRRVDPAAYAGLEATRGPGTRRDLGALEAWRRRYAGRAAAANARVNDAYLRAQGQADGMASYGRMVDLLLAERRLTGLPTTPGPR
jgi:hypothetical protein